MKVKEKILVSVIGISTIFLIANPIKSKAALQANPTTHATPASKTGAAWQTQIRQMETTGQTMGLNETLSGLNATSESNNIDVHMMLPSEYGAIAILSASGYGNLGKLRDETDPQKRTSTGNVTGVYFTGDRWEWMASNADGGLNKYNESNGSKVGSILNGNGVAGWHNGVKNTLAHGTGGTPDNKTFGYTFGGSGIMSYGHVSWIGWGVEGWKNGNLLARGTAVIEQ